MSTILKFSHPRMIAGVSALALALALSGVALAGGPPYTVKVKVVPSAVPLPGTFKVTASGLSDNTSQLKVFLNRTHPCALTAAGDAAIPGDVLEINKRVVHLYSKSRTFTAPHAGRHYACAYLTALPPAMLLRAHSGAAYTVG